MGNARKGKKILRQLLTYAVNTVSILFLLLPLVALLFGSVQTEKDLAIDVQNPLPNRITFINFVRLFQGTEVEASVASYIPPNMDYLGRAFFNSTFVSLTVTLAILVLGSLSAYSISRLREKWTTAFLYVSLAVRLLPVMALMVPLYITLRGFHMLNSLTGIIITEVGFLVPYAIWILTSFFSTLPRGLEDAARIDGCSRIQVLLRIILPLSTPGIASCGVIIFIMSWNELVIPLIVSTQPQVMTIPVLLAGLTGDRYLFYTLMMAICLIALTPTVILALLLRKYVVRGLTAGALKG